LARFGDQAPNFPGFLDLMYAVCEECMKYKDEITQIGVGMLLKELSLSPSASKSK